MSGAAGPRVPFGVGLEKDPRPTEIIIPKKQKSAGFASAAFPFSDNGQPRQNAILFETLPFAAKIPGRDRKIIERKIARSD
jgi:hypothetical protein